MWIDTDGLRRMSYTLELASKGVTGFGQSTILKAIECGGIDRTNNLFGNWKIEYREPRQTYLPSAESADQDAPQATAAPDAPHLEAEMAALINAAEASLRQPDAGHRDAADAFHRPAIDPNRAAEPTAAPPKNIESKNIESKVNEPPAERRAWDTDIRIDDPERAAKAGASPRVHGAYAVLAALLGASATGWIVGLPPALVGGHPSVPVEQKGDSSGLVPVSKNHSAVTGPETGRNATGGVSSTGKIAASAPGVHSHRPGHTKSAAQQTGAIRTSAVALPNSGPSEPAARIRPRAADMLPSPVPFPETRPATIEGWTVRDVSGATAVLEGPDGIWRAARGDTVPRVGRVESIVRWGSRWIVVTSSGLISTP
jgi:hypothetical protein